MKSRDHDVEVAESDERTRQLELRMAELRDELATVQRETVSAAQVQRAVALFDPVWNLLLFPERFRTLHVIYASPRAPCGAASPAPQQRLYFLPLPHEHGSFRPGVASRRTGLDCSVYSVKSSSWSSTSSGWQGGPSLACISAGKYSSSMSTLTTHGSDAASTSWSSTFSNSGTRNAPCSHARMMPLRGYILLGDPAARLSQTLPQLNE